MYARMTGSTMVSFPYGDELSGLRLPFQAHCGAREKIATRAALAGAQRHTPFRQFSQPAIAQSVATIPVSILPPMCSSSLRPWSLTVSVSRSGVYALKNGPALSRCQGLWPDRPGSADSVEV